MSDTYDTEGESEVTAAITKAAKTLAFYAKHPVEDEALRWMWEHVDEYKNALETAIMSQMALRDDITETHLHYFASTDRPVEVRYCLARNPLVLAFSGLVASLANDAFDVVRDAISQTLSSNACHTQE